MGPMKPLSIPHLKSPVEFKEAIQSEKVIVEFYAPWCPPCKKYCPIFDDLSKKYSNFKFRLIDVENEDMEDVVRDYNVSGLPTYVIFKKGKKVKKIVGFKKDTLLEYLDEKKYM